MARMSKLGQLVASVQHDGKVELHIETVGTSATTNILDDTRFTAAFPATRVTGPLLIRNPHATAKVWFRFGVDPTASDTTSFRLDPSESIILPSGMTDVRLIASAAATPVHLLLFYPDDSD